jgi:hypothetical protein
VILPAQQGVPPHATYTCCAIMLWLQDAAYGTLLRDATYHIHRRIGRAQNRSKAQRRKPTSR